MSQDKNRNRTPEEIRRLEMNRQIIAAGPRPKQISRLPSERLQRARCPTIVFVASESVAAEVAGSHPADDLTALQVRIHRDLRSQHPEWVESNGDCPMCDFYEARLAGLLEGYAQNGSDESVAAIHRAIQEAAAVNRLPAA